MTKKVEPNYPDILIEPKDRISLKEYSEIIHALSMYIHNNENEVEDAEIKDSVTTMKTVREKLNSVRGIEKVKLFNVLGEEKEKE